MRSTQSHQRQTTLGADCQFAVQRSTTKIALLVFPGVAHILLALLPPRAASGSSSNVVALMQKYSCVRLRSVQELPDEHFAEDRAEGPQAAGDARSVGGGGCHSRAA